MVRKQRESYRGIPRTDKTLECIVDGCSNLRRTRDLCGTHYNVFLSGKDPHNYYDDRKGKAFIYPIVDGMKQCSKCSLWKPVETDFYTITSPNGTKSFYGHCKKCHYEYRKPQYEIEKAERAVKRAEAKKAREARANLPCTFEGCDKKIKARGLCFGHLNQFYTKGKVTELRTNEKSYIDEHNRKCTDCDEIKVHNDFYERPQGGVQSVCKECWKIRGSFNQALRKGQFELAEHYLNLMTEKARVKYQDRFQSKLALEGGNDE